MARIISFFAFYLRPHPAALITHVPRTSRNLFDGKPNHLCYFLFKNSVWQAVTLSAFLSAAVHTCQVISQLLKPECPPALALVPVCQSTGAEWREPLQAQWHWYCDQQKPAKLSLLLYKLLLETDSSFSCLTSFSHVSFSFQVSSVSLSCCSFSCQTLFFYLALSPWSL